MDDVRYAVLDGAYWAAPHDEDCPRCALVRESGAGSPTAVGEGGGTGAGPVEAGRGQAARWVDCLQDVLVDGGRPHVRAALLIGSVTTVLAATATRWS
ncbi:hypothetical protein [Streptomyces sp. NPDC051211]|uniref:hypothetical protein n=1 Tax=Streptomyces sp. NPDC051211 TaxID=3154643 RepID=UPI00344B7495